jgi:hypothetical protein
MRHYQRYYGDFANALKQVAAARKTFATPKEGMIDRMKQGANSGACKRWAWFNASFNEVDGKILATRAEFNPLSLVDEMGNYIYAQRAVDAQRTVEFYLTDDMMLENEPITDVLNRIAERDAIKPVNKRRVLDLGQTKTHNVPTDCYADDDTIVFLAEGKKRAEKYGLFIRNAFGKNSIPESIVYMQDLIGKNKSRGFALSSVDAGSGSGFGCGDWDLYDDGGSVFGGYEIAEGGAKNLGAKQGLPYNQKQVEAELRRISGLEKELAKSKDFFERLRRFKR